MVVDHRDRQQRPREPSGDTPEAAGGQATQDDDAASASEQSGASEAPRRKRTARQEAMQVDSAKVMRTLVTAAIKRRLPRLIERLVKRQRTLMPRKGKRKRESDGSEQRGQRRAMRAGQSVIEHV